MRRKSPSKISASQHNAIIFVITLCIPGGRSGGKETCGPKEMEKRRQETEMWSEGEREKEDKSIPLHHKQGIISQTSPPPFLCVLSLAGTEKDRQKLKN